MKWFAVIDFRDDKFSRQRVINISVDIKTVGKDWLVARNIRFAEAIANYTIISRTRVIVGLQYASTFLNFCCNVVMYMLIMNGSIFFNTISCKEYLTIVIYLE